MQAVERMVFQGPASRWFCWCQSLLDPQDGSSPDLLPHAPSKWAGGGQSSGRPDHTEEVKFQNHWELPQIPLVRLKGKHRLPDVGGTGGELSRGCLLLGLITLSSCVSWTCRPGHRNVFLCATPAWLPALDARRAGETCFVTAPLGGRAPAPASSSLSGAVLRKSRCCEQSETRSYVQALGKAATRVQAPQGSSLAKQAHCFLTAGAVGKRAVKTFPEYSFACLGKRTARLGSPSPAFCTMKA